MLKLTVYRPTAAKNYSGNSVVSIFGQKVQKTGFIPPILGGGKWVSGGVGLKELNVDRNFVFILLTSKLGTKKFAP